MISQKGFSLFELSLLVGIAAILIIALVPHFLFFSKEAKALTTKEIAKNIEEALSFHEIQLRDNPYYLYHPIKNCTDVAKIKAVGSLIPRGYVIQSKAIKNGQQQRCELLGPNVGQLAYFTVTGHS